MKNLSEFASQSNPIRCSAIPKLFQCPFRAVMEFMAICDEDTSGPAADTGSALHHAIALWHKQGTEVKEAIRQMREALPTFPLADLDDAERQFLHYCLDPRNRTAKIVACEEPI